MLVMLGLVLLYLASCRLEPHSTLPSRIFEACLFGRVTDVQVKQSLQDNYVHEGRISGRFRRQNSG